MKTLEREEIEHILPHRGRALLLDRIEIDEGKSIGYLRIREEHCEGHIPGFPIFRGVDRIEMITLTLGVAVQSHLATGQMFYLAKIREARFPGIARLGDLVRAEVIITRRTNRRLEGSGKAFVGDQLITEVNKVTGVIRKIP